MADTLGPGLRLLSGLEAIEERCRQRLAFLQGEWYQDQAEGLPWYDELLGRQLGPELLARTLGAELELLDGVSSVIDTRSRFNETETPGEPRFEAELDLLTSYGATTIRVEVLGQA